MIEYRIVVTNNASNSPAGQRPLYNLTVTDTVPAKLNLSSADQGADTNGSNASIEVANTGGASGLGAAITFTQANTNITTAGSNFTRLDPGQTLTLLYRGTLAGTVIPSEILPNAAATFGYSVPVDGSFQAVNQTAPKGTAAVNNPSATARHSLRCRRHRRHRHHRRHHPAKGPQRHLRPRLHRSPRLHRRTTPLPHRPRPPPGHRPRPRGQR